MTRQELEQARDALIAKNQDLGRQIEVLRESRREINEQVGQLNAALSMMASLPGSRSAEAPGAVVEVDAEEVLGSMLAAVKKSKAH